MTTIPTPCKDFSCQQLLSSSDLIHHGGLRQRKNVHRIVENTLPTVINIKWTRRYAVLHNSCLYLFKDEMSPHPLHSSTSLFGFTTCECCSQEVSSHIPWPFKLSSELETRPRIYYFSSASQNESLKWVEMINQQMILANSYVTYSTPKGTTFGLFPPDAPSAEALPVPRSRQRSGSDSITLASVARRQRSLPPTPNVDSDGERWPYSAEASEEHTSGDSDEYDELIDVSKPIEAGNIAAGVLAGLRKLMTLSRFTSEEIEGKMPHSLSSPSAFEAQIQPIDSDNSSQTSDKPDNIQEMPTSPLSPKPMSPTSVSPTSPIRTKPMTAVKPNVTIQKNSPQTPRLLPQKESPTQRSPPKPAPRQRTLSDSPTCVEPGMMGAYWSKSANEGEELMKSLTDVGTFMIRESQEPGQQTLMVRCEDSVRKYRIYSDEDGKFYLDASNPRFTTRSALVAHYKQHYLPQRTLLLTNPYSTVMLTAANATVADAATYL